MADGGFPVSVLTPESRLLEVEARAVVLRSSRGDLTILDGHTPIITDVVPGAVRVDRVEGEPVRLAVHGGYMQVETGLGIGGSDFRSTRIALLAGVAELADQIDVPRAERAREAAEARVEALRAATGRGTGGGGAAGGGGGAAGGSGGAAGGSGGAAGGGGGAAGEGGEAEGAVSPEELELAEAEAALQRAVVRLEVAGVSPS